MEIDKLNDFLSLYGSIRMGSRINLNKNASHPFIREFVQHLNACNGMFRDQLEAACNEIEDNVMKLSLLDKPKIKHYLQNVEALINDRTADLKGITVKDISEKLLNKTKWSAYDTYLYNCDQCKDIMLNEVRRLRAKYLGKPKDQQKTKRKPENLKDIWAGSDQDYNRIMKQLELKGYVEVRNGKIYWNCSQRGAVKYAAGFIYQMTKKGWIKDWQSAPVYKRIFENTFNFSFNAEPFKSLNSGGLKREYLDPFALIPPRK